MIRPVRRLPLEAAPALHTDGPRDSQVLGMRLKWVLEEGAEYSSCRLFVLADIGFDTIPDVGCSS